MHTAPQADPLAAATWRKASRSQGETSDCVEVARIPEVVGIRDSKDPHGPRFVLGLAAVRQLAADVRRGRYDL